MSSSNGGEEVDMDLLLTTACVHIAEKQGTRFIRRVRIVPTNRKKCAWSSSDIWAHVKAATVVRKGTTLKPIIYVNKNVFADPDLDMMRLVKRVISVAHEVDFESTTASGVGRNL